MRKMPKTTKHGGMSPAGEKCKAMCPSDAKTGSTASKGPKKSNGMGGH